MLRFAKFQSRCHTGLTLTQMKKLTCVLALFTLLHTCVCAQKITTIPANAPGMHQKKIGTTLTVCGGVVLVIGTVLAATADSYSYNYSTNSNGQVQESGDAKGAIGVVLIAAGIGMTIPGVIIWSKGVKRLNNYKQTVSFKTKGASVGVAFRF